MENKKSVNRTFEEEMVIRAKKKQFQRISTLTFDLDLAFSQIELLQEENQRLKEENEELRNQSPRQK